MERWVMKTLQQDIEGVISYTANPDEQIVVIMTLIQQESRRQLEALQEALRDYESSLWSAYGEDMDEFVTQYIEKI